MAIVVPEQIYIGYSIRYEGNWNVPIEDREETILGFATYYEKNKACEKRQDTINHWSKPYLSHRIDEDHPEWDPEGSHYQTVQEERPELEAKVIDNPLQEGFKMARDVKRYGWNGGNVVWRIEDPRGFELEIPSANMASIMATTTIINGVIQGKCKWAWDKTGGSRVILLPEDSEPYQEAMEDNALHNAKPLKIGDINIGDTVKLKNGTIGTYAGSFYYVQHSELEKLERHNLQTTGCSWTTSKKKTHFFYTDQPEFSDYKHDKIMMIASPKVVRVVEHAKEEIDIKDSMDELNSRIRLEESIQSYNYVNPIAVSDVPIELGKLPIGIVPIDDEDAQYILESPRHGDDVDLCYQAFPMIFEYQNKWYRHTNARGGCYSNNKPVTINCTEIDINALTDDNAYRPVGRLEKQRGNWYNSSSELHFVENRKEIEADTIDQLRKYIFAIEIGGRLYSPRIY